MTNILDKILSTKVLEVEQAKSIKSIDKIKDEIRQASKPRDFIQRVLLGLILIQILLPNLMN